MGLTLDGFVVNLKRHNMKASLHAYERGYVYGYELKPVFYNQLTKLSSGKNKVVNHIGRGDTIYLDPDKLSVTSVTGLAKVKVQFSLWDGRMWFLDDYPMIQLDQDATVLQQQVIQTLLSEDSSAKEIVQGIKALLPEWEDPGLRHNYLGGWYLMNQSDMDYYIDDMVRDLGSLG